VASAVSTFQGRQPYSPPVDYLDGDRLSWFEDCRRVALNQPFTNAG
jgi:hypothetical protein